MDVTKEGPSTGTAFAASRQGRQVAGTSKVPVYVPAMAAAEVLGMDEVAVTPDETLKVRQKITVYTKVDLTKSIGHSVELEKRSKRSPRGVRPPDA